MTEKVSKLEEILLEWDKDGIISDSKLDTESLNTPKLHGKYLRHLMSAKEKLSKAKYDVHELKILKKRYYTGALSKEELEKLGWEQYQLAKPLKAELEDILAGDKDMVKLKLKIEYLETIVTATEYILTQLRSRDFQIKNAITWKQFQSGA